MRELGFAIAFVLLLVVAYMGTYFALVTRTLSSDWQELAPRYRIGGEVTVALFAHCHEFDRKIFRTDYWTDKKARWNLIVDLL